MSNLIHLVTSSSANWIASIDFYLFLDSLHYDSDLIFHHWQFHLTWNTFFFLFFFSNWDDNHYISPRKNTSLKRIENLFGFNWISINNQIRIKLVHAKSIKLVELDHEGKCDKFYSKLIYCEKVFNSTFFSSLNSVNQMNPISDCKVKIGKKQH